MKAQGEQSAEDIQEWLVLQLADLLVLAPGDIDVREPLDTYGLASREAVMLSGDLEDWLGRKLSPTLLYEYPTIEALARYLVGDAAITRSGSHRSKEDHLDGMITRLEQLSEDEAETMLLDRLGALEEN